MTPPPIPHRLSPNTLGRVITDIIGPNPAGFILTGPDGNVCWFNEPASEVISKAPLEFGKSLFSQLAGDLRERLPLIMQESEKSGKPREIPFFNKKIHYNIRVMPVQDDTFTGFSLSVTDKTHSDNLQRLLRAVLNTSVSGVMALDAIRTPKNEIADFRWTLVNFATELLFGHKQEELLGKYLKQEMPWLVQCGLFEKFKLVADGKLTLQQEIPFDQDGQIKLWFFVSATRVNNGLAVTFTDITEKKAFEKQLTESLSQLADSQQELSRMNNHLEEIIDERTRRLESTEELMNTLASVTNDALWDWNCVENVLWFNEAFHRTYHYPEVHFREGIRRFIEAIHPENRKRVRNALSQTVRNREKEWSGEFRFSDYHGHYVHVLCRIYFLRDEKAQVYRVIGSMVDITRYREYEDALESSLARIKKMNAETKSFTESLITDIKNPLRAISSLAHWVLEEEPGLTPKGKYQLELLQQKTEAAVSVLKNIINRQKETDPFTTGTDLRNLIDSLQHCYRNVSVQARIDRPIRLMGEPEVMEKLFRDMLDNINAEKHPEVQIQITTGKANCNFSVFGGRQQAQTQSTTDVAESGIRYQHEICSFSLPLIRRDQRWDRP